MGGCDFGLLANRMAQSHAVNRVGIRCHDCRIRNAGRARAYQRSRGLRTPRVRRFRTWS